MKRNVDSFFPWSSLLWAVFYEWRFVREMRSGRIEPTTGHPKWEPPQVRVTRESSALFLGARGISSTRQRAILGERPPICLRVRPNLAEGEHCPRGCSSFCLPKPLGARTG